MKRALRALCEAVIVMVMFAGVLVFFGSCVLLGLWFGGL